ncbi:tetratricopeptide repeat protein [Patescibacteria group bacterium]|nr:tetratricopeptide repeat protein [Patescibacteria group bacterium]MBU1705415.1 tetratricopeptide repeat protein [Patescibacteria group bacterium]
MSEAKTSFRLSGNSFVITARWLCYGLLFLMPLFYLPVSLDPLEINKQTLLVLVSFVGLILWLGAMIFERTLVFRRGWLNLFPPLVFLAILLAAIFSQGPYLSWLGHSTEEFTSVLSFAGYLAVFFLMANVFTRLVDHQRAFAVILVSAFLAGLWGTLSLFGLNLFPGLDYAAANTLGGINDFVLFLVVITVLANALWMSHTPESTLFHNNWFGWVEKFLVLAISGLTFTALLLVDYSFAWILLLAGLLISFVFVFMRLRDFPNYNRFLLPFLLIIASLPFLFYFGTPFKVELPIEVSPNYTATWNIARETLANDSAILGSGPGTFTYDYAKYRPLEVNQSQFWNYRFDRGASFALTSLATVGLLGALVWLLFILGTFGRTLSHIFKAREREDWLPSFVLISGWSTLIVAAFLFSLNLTSLFLIFALAGLLASRVMKASVQNTFTQSPRLGLLFSFIFVLVSVGIVSVIFITGQRYLAEAAFGQAIRLDSSGAELTQVVDELDRAAQANRFQDIYYRNLSHALLLRVGEELQSQDQEEQMTQARLQYIQALTGASINAAVRATELAPHSVLNWLTRANTYREFIPIIGADAEKFAMSSGEQAVELEPNNPANYVDLGQTYLLIADNSMAMTQSEDPEVKQEAQAKVDNLLSQAEGVLLQAIELKDDYPVAHYQLAIVYDRQGELEKSIAKMETVAKQNQLDVGVAFQLGLLYLRRNGEDDLNRAQNAFDHAVELAPSYSDARWFLAAVYEQLGDFDSAIEQVLKVQELNPDNQVVAERLESLKAGQAAAELPQPLAGEEGIVQVPDGQPVQGPGSASPPSANQAESETQPTGF